MRQNLLHMEGGRERETETYDDLLLQNFVDEVIRYLNHKLRV